VCRMRHIRAMGTATVMLLDKALGLWNMHALALPE